VEKKEEASARQDVTSHLPDEVVTATVVTQTITQPAQTPQATDPKPRRVSLDEKLQAVVVYLRDNGQQTEDTIKNHFSVLFNVSLATVSHWLLTLRQGRKIEDKVVGNDRVYFLPK